MAKYTVYAGFLQVHMKWPQRAICGHDCLHHLHSFALALRLHLIGIKSLEIQPLTEMTETCLSSLPSKTCQHKQTDGKIRQSHIVFPEYFSPWMFHRLKDFPPNTADVCKCLYVIQPKSMCHNYVLMQSKLIFHLGFPLWSSTGFSLRCNQQCLQDPLFPLPDLIIGCF